MSHVPVRSRRRRILTGVLSILAIPVAAWLLHPWPLPLRWIDPGTTAYMEHRQRQAVAVGEALELKQSWIPLDSVSPHLVRAVLIAEDDRFREHRGVDWEALAEETGYRGGIPPSMRDPADRAELLAAVQRVRSEREGIRGRSTITQQLARNLYLSPERAFTRKAQELLLARRLETFLSKDRILELYLNVAELGPGVFGVEAAAQTYFGRSAGQLSREQAAALAATLPHPLGSNPAHNPGRMQWRQNLILTRMMGGQRPVPPPEPVELEPLDPVIPAVPDLEAPPEADTLPSDTLLSDTLPFDTLPRDTLPPDSAAAGPDPAIPPQPGTRPSDFQR